MKSRFTLVASCLSFLVTGSCTSSNPTQIGDLAMSLDMSVGLADLATPDDLTTLPPDLVPGCGYGQTLIVGSCACDIKHTSICSAAYCCEAAQNCLPTPGPRGETRCSGPSVREGSVMGYDPARGNLVLRTGHCLDSAMNDTLCTDQWVLGPITWGTQQPTTAITPRFGSNVAWLPSNSALLLFGGQTVLNNAATAVNDLYSWNGTDWAKLAPAISPTARAFTSMAWDQRRQTMVMFGGNNTANTSLSDTWEYKAGNWQQRTPANNVPPAREGHALVFDGKIQRIVMHAGLVAGLYDKDTWIFDGNDWTKLANNAAMPIHAYFGMAYDPIREVTVLYGGETAGSAPVGETWEFNGTTSTWAQRITALNPGKRSKPAMAYDPSRKQIVVFGGNDGTKLLKDAWTWDGTAWNQIY